MPVAPGISKRTSSNSATPSVSDESSNRQKRHERRMTPVRSTLLAIGVIGALLFGAAFFTSLVDPVFVERIAKDIIRQQVEKRVQERIDVLDESYLANQAGRLIKGMQQKVEDTRRALKERLPERIATVIAEMAKADCECRKKLETSIRGGLEGIILSAALAQEQLTTLIRTKYMETAGKLTREFRIFTGTNAFVFALLGLAAYLKPAAGLQLLPATVILVLAALINACLYFFKQNWLHTLVFSNYVGLAYVAYMAVVFVVLCDIIFNRGRVTTQVLNAALNAVGSVTVLPC
ncbi:MAG: hypothetical protein ABI790_17620 [Betaproteobacteria bacterium]